MKALIKRSGSWIEILTHSETSDLHVVRPMEKKPSGNGLDWEVSEDWQNHGPDWQITNRCDDCDDLEVNDIFGILLHFLWRIVRKGEIR